MVLNNAATIRGVRPPCSEKNDLHKKAHCLNGCWHFSPVVPSNAASAVSGFSRGTLRSCLSVFPHLSDHFLVGFAFLFYSLSAQFHGCFPQFVGGWLMSMSSVLHLTPLLSSLSPFPATIPTLSAALCSLSLSLIF